MLPGLLLQPVSEAKLESGLVVAGHGRHVLVERADGERLICHPRGKKSQAVVGDHVLWLATQDEGTIEKVQPRRNLFYRQDKMRTKSFAANLDQVLILIAAEPEFSESQLSRALIAAEAEHIQPLIALNKSDLRDAFARAWDRLQPYRAMGYPVLPLALKPREEPLLATAQDQLLAVLRDKTTLVLGPSGSGKSSLINRLLPDAGVLTQEISTALNSGKHTTTHARLYHLNTGSQLIDCPGVQAFGLHHLTFGDIEEGFAEFSHYRGQCRFNNCRHLHEPGCALRLAAEQGIINARRLQLFQEISHAT